MQLTEKLEMFAEENAMLLMKLQKTESKLDMVEKSFEMINNDRNEIVGIKAGLIKLIKTGNVYADGTSWKNDIQRILDGKT